LIHEVKKEKYVWRLTFTICLFLNAKLATNPLL
jgi:hypothetical protein